MLSYARESSDTRITSEKEGNRVRVALSCAGLTYCLASAQAQDTPSSTIKRITSLNLRLCTSVAHAGSLTDMHFVVLFWFILFVPPFHCFG